MKILVSGGCGFVGSNTCKYFIDQGHEVIAYDNLTAFELKRTGYDIVQSRNHNLQFLKSIGAKIVKADILDQNMLDEYARSCDYIIHTAAQPAMTIALENPKLDFKTNVIGTFNVLEAARKYDIPMVNCSSIHVYGNDINQDLIEYGTRFIRRPPSIDEKQPVLQGDITPLHASKLTGELWTNAFIDTYGLKATNFRLTGMYGPRQFGGMDHGWVANFAIRTIMNQPITIFDTDKQVRDILYVDDVAHAFDKFYQYQVPGTYNVGGGCQTSISIKECLELIHEITRIKQDIRFDKSRKGDLYYFVCDINKINQKLKWAPTVMPQNGIAELIEWIEQNKSLFGSS